MSTAWASTIYGLGGDGNISLSANQSLSISRDMYYENVSLSSATLITNGYKVFVNQTLTMSNNALIRPYYSGGPYGGAGGSASGGTGGTAYASSYFQSTGTLGIGTAGGNGGNAFANGSAGQSVLLGQGNGGLGAHGGYGGPSGTNLAGAYGNTSITASIQRLSGELASWVPEQYMMVQATTTQTIGNASVTNMIFAATPLTSIGTAISYNGSNLITFNQAGLYKICFTATFAENGDNGQRLAWISINGTGRYGMQRLASYIQLDEVDLSGSAFYMASVGDTAALAVYQDSGAATTSDTNPYNYLQIELVNTGYQLINAGCGGGGGAGGTGNSGSSPGAGGAGGAGGGVLYIAANTIYRDSTIGTNFGLQASGGYAGNGSSATGSILAGGGGGGGGGAGGWIYLIYDQLQGTQCVWLYANGQSGGYGGAGVVGGPTGSNGYAGTVGTIQSICTSTGTLIGSYTGTLSL